MEEELEATIRRLARIVVKIGMHNKPDGVLDEVSYVYHIGTMLSDELGKIMEEMNEFERIKDRCDPRS